MLYGPSAVTYARARITTPGWRNLLMSGFLEEKSLDRASSPLGARCTNSIFHAPRRATDPSRRNHQAHLAQRGPRLSPSAATTTADTACYTTRAAGLLGRCAVARRSTKRTTNPSRYVSIKFAAERADVSTDTIRRMIADGTLAAYRFRGQIRIAIEDIDAAMWPIN
ncbi:excisionase family DNA-binding protein [Nocardia sp. NPDC056952]|uniref:excisionase family DNA-binding protein n=1 Tax=Nocardia sp. NPDC056952 TaxID=3345979 RepID=UPI0036380357